MDRRKLGIVLCVTLVLAAGCIPNFEQRAVQFAAVNDWREFSGDRRVAWSWNLAGDAQEHSDWMAATGRAEHSDVNRLLFKYGRYFHACAEILAIGPANLPPLEYVAAWVRSPPHLVALNGDQWSEGGIGIAYSGTTVWITQLFCD